MMKSLYMKSFSLCSSTHYIFGCYLPSKMNTHIGFLSHKSKDWIQMIEPPIPTSSGPCVMSKFCNGMPSLVRLASCHGHTVHSYVICQFDDVVTIVPRNGLFTWWTVQEKHTPITDIDMQTFTARVWIQNWYWCSTICVSVPLQHYFFSLMKLSNTSDKSNTDKQMTI